MFDHLTSVERELIGQLESPSAVAGPERFGDSTPLTTPSIADSELD